MAGNSKAVDGSFDAFFYDHGGSDFISNLTRPQGYKRTGAAALNATRHVLGFATRVEGDDHVVVWDAGVIPSSILFNLGPGFGIALNALDDVLFTPDAAPNHSAVSQQELSILQVHPRRLIDLGSLGGTFTSGHGINDFRQVVGVSQTAAGALHPFLWQNGAMRDLTELNRGLTGPVQINNPGDVIASWYPMFPRSPVRHGAVISREGRFVDLGYQGSTYTTADWINDAGVIVGTSGQGAAAITVLWRPDGTVVDTVPINAASGINNAGMLTYNSPQKHAFLLTPMGGKTLTRPETDAALGLIRNLRAEILAAGQAAQGESAIALLFVIVPDLLAAERHLDRGFTLGAVGELKAILRIIQARVSPAAGGTPERINRVKALITRLGGSPDV